MFLDGGRKPENPERTRREPTHTRGEHADSTQTGPQVGIEPGTLSL